MLDLHQGTHPHGTQGVARGGAPVDQAEAAFILVHGRGATAESILDLGETLAPAGVALLAPRAAGNTWYPYSFLAPLGHNQPGLDSALRILADLVAEVEAAGVPADKIIVGGFSQGACLASEFIARGGRPLGGLLAFSGGVIGPPGTPRDYDGDLAGMPVFIGCSDVDAHIPLERVRETIAVFEALGAAVTRRIYPGMGHLINRDELEQGRLLIQRVLD